ncbi:DUF4255 domain-containing protein [Streptomyces chilikensis]|uniref:DUF4255 domain-containing protein n=1 Tax=Streptomyces chilikensis TaxID=1194079 RepID=UPI00140BC3E0|nr:DUF4255 domain-containing protein [Streptomyces chilikensis]
MSNALAIAHVTRALCLLLASNVGPEFGEAVQVEPRKPPAEPPDQPTLNVFLYQVTPNTSMRHNDLPTRSPGGSLVKRPAAALDLHFLISAYGNETYLVGQRLIGSVVRTLHEIPVLPKNMIEQAAEEDPYLADSDLVEAAQRVRFSPTVMDIDETSKLWGMLHQTPYALSVVYQASLVFIDGRGTPMAAKPVERPEVRVLPFGAPGAPVPPVLDGSGPAEGGEESVPATGPVTEAAANGTAGTAAKTAVRAPAKTAIARTPAKAPTKTSAKAPARTAARTPARGRKAAQGGRSAKTDGATGTTGAADTAGESDDTAN